MRKEDLIGLYSILRNVMEDKSEFKTEEEKEVYKNIEALKNSIDNLNEGSN